jgi:outer membrane protein assembly factor BamB
VKRNMAVCRMGVLSLTVVAVAATLRAADDWPQFRGPARDGKCTEKGLLSSWPSGGPKLLWKLTGLGRGYSTVSIADGRLLTMGDRKDPNGGESQFVIAFDLATRKELWATRIGPPHGDGGPRSTPTIDGALTYAIGTDGDLLCVETASGKTRWHKSVTRDLGGQMMSMWKFSESPLVDGDKLVCTPGMPQATLAALDKNTGELLWKCAAGDIGSAGKDGAGYSSMVVAEIHGKRQYVQLYGRGLVGVAADTGELLWSYNRVANNVANITTPVVRDDYVFDSTSYGTGSALLRISHSGRKWTAKEVYFLPFGEFNNHHGGVVLVGDYLYGGHGQNQGTPTCIDFLSGKIVWKQRAPSSGSAAVLYADGNLIFRYDKGPVVLLAATPKGLHIRGKFQPPVVDGPAWQYPVIHDGKLYLRAHNVLMCYDVRAAE